MIRSALWVGGGLAAILVLIWLPLAARHGAPTWPVADVALIEISTIHAARGEQLLGAYSQYGWYHPGPLLFYLLAPFYIAGGRTLHGLNVGALAINLGSLLPVAWILGRRSGLSPATALTVLLGLLVYVVRTAGLLTSAWNPHVSVWPFAALLVCSAAIVSGDLGMLPLWVVFASLVTQTHVGFAPVALTLGALTVAVFMWRVATGRSRNHVWSLALLSLVILQLIWLPVFADQLAGHPGNLTKLWRFFVETSETQTLNATVRAWSSMLMGILRPDLMPPVGWAFGATTPLPIIVGAILTTAALPAVIIVGWRRGYRFESALASVCLTATVVAFWSVRHIRGPILDNQLFWLSVLGVFDLSLAIGLLASAVDRWKLVAWQDSNVQRVAAAALVITGVAIGARRSVEQTGAAQLPADSESVRRLTTMMRQSFPTMGARRPLFRIDAPTWGIGFGLILQMRRVSIPATMDPGVAAAFDPILTANGEEDVLVTLSDFDRHQRLLMRPGNVTLAESNSRTRLYVDAVSLVDHPEYRR